MRRFRALVCLGAWALGACSTLSPVEHATGRDYAVAEREFRGGNPRGALDAFPRQEPNGFITTVERGWLALLAERPETESLLELTSDMEDRKTLRLTREARSFFYKDAPDGYFPAEHEAIVVHLICAMSLLREDRTAEALVDLRRASRYLESDFADKDAQAGFDDAGLRVWLGTLWLAAGDWAHARVDFRVAARLSPAFSALKALAERDTPPKTFALALSGPGPWVDWRPQVVDLDFIGGATRLAFRGGEAPRAFTFVDENAQKEVSFSPPFATLGWYARHQDRDHAAKTVLDRSEYMLRATGGGALAGATIVLGTGTAILLGAAGVGGGIAFAFVMLRAAVLYDLDAELAVYVGIGGGFMIAGLGLAAANAVYGASKAASDSALKGALSKADVYRYVRFLPDHIAVASADVPFERPVLRQLLDANQAPTLSKNGAHVFVSPAPRRASDLVGGKLADWSKELRGRRITLQVVSTDATHQGAEAACAELGDWRLPDADALRSAFANGFILPGDAAAAWVKTACSAIASKPSPREVRKTCKDRLVAVCMRVYPK